MSRALRPLPVLGSLMLFTTPALAQSGDAGAVASAPGPSSLLPAIVAIGLALLSRQVIPSLLAGVWIGASLHHGGPFVGLLRTLDEYLIGAGADTDHMKIVVFSLLLGGMVGVVSRLGGMQGLVDRLAPLATTGPRGQAVTWAMGLLIFFDDYANTLVVGNTMRPVTDRLRISREKLAYIVDSTAAPVASLFLVSTWIGYQVSMIGEGLTQSGIDSDAYSIFLRSLPYNFYPTLTLGFVLMIALSGRDFGPMLTAERRAATGEVLRKGSTPLAGGGDSAELQPEPGRPVRALDGALPIATVLVVTFTALWITGRQALREGGNPLGSASPFSLGIQGLGAVLGESSSYNALIYASFAGCLVALVLASLQGGVRLRGGIEAWLAGMRSMMPAMVVLLLAWSISKVCADLNTAGFLSGLIAKSSIGLSWLPLLIFVLAAAAAFGTGSSWATMGILVPIAISTVVELGGTAAVDGAILPAAVSAVLAGAIFGDHCSPISDTTVLSSMASGCDHVDHVRTQLPYALFTAAVAVVTGYVPLALGLPAVASLLIGFAALFVALRVIARPSVAPRQ